jgi:deoxycytidylate deaminase
MLINAGVRRVIYAGRYPDEYSRQFLDEAGVVLIHLDGPVIPVEDP